MDLKPDKRTWNDFILEHKGSFLQSFEWGEFQESFGRRVFSFGGFDAGYAAQFIEYKLPLGKNTGIVREGRYSKVKIMKCRELKSLYLK